jgi:hypothetical protein
MRTLPFLLLLLRRTLVVSKAPRASSDWAVAEKTYEKVAAEWEEGDETAELTTEDQQLYYEMETRKKHGDMQIPPAEFDME